MVLVLLAVRENKKENSNLFSILISLKSKCRQGSFFLLN